MHMQKKNVPNYFKMQLHMQNSAHILCRYFYNFCICKFGIYAFCAVIACSHITRILYIAPD